MEIIKLRTENLAAAYATVAFLIKNPGTNQTNVYRFINTQKKCLRGYKDPMHYRNYYNIMFYLHINGLIRTENKGRSILYYAVTQ
jgi:hypothetical protein